jgi:hypothetical protein
MVIYLNIDIDVQPVKWKFTVTVLLNHRIQVTFLLVSITFENEVSLLYTSDKWLIKGGTYRLDGPRECIWASTSNVQQDLYKVVQFPGPYPH